MLKCMSEIVHKLVSEIDSDVWSHAFWQMQIDAGLSQASQGRKYEIKLRENLLLGNYLIFLLFD